MSDELLLDIHKATIWRGRTCVFKDLNLSIRIGEQLAILGPNGCGKTTLLKTLNRELYPVANTGSYLRVLGKERWNVWELRRHIGIVSSDLQRRYPDECSALEMVISGFHASVGIHGSIAERVKPQEVTAARAVLDELGVGEYANTPLRELSTGQQRRCLLARALVHDPGVLISTNRPRVSTLRRALITCDAFANWRTTARVSLLSLTTSMRYHLKSSASFC